MNAIVLNDLYALWAAMARVESALFKAERRLVNVTSDWKAARRS